MHEDKRTKKLLSDIQSSVNCAKEKLQGLGLLRGYNTLTISQDNCIVPACDGDWDICHSIAEHYERNSGCYVFKLIDYSFFAIYVVAKNGKPLRFSYSYCSCPNILQYLSDEDGFGESYHDEMGFGHQNSLIAYYSTILKNRAKLSNRIATAIHQSSMHPIYIRCDYDPENKKPEHPEFHLSLNFIEDSRFTIDQNINYYDFVVFILDVLYGIKNQSNKQYIHLNICP